MVCSEAYGARDRKAVGTLTKSQDHLLAFLDFPAEHRIHLRTTNLIESTISTLKARMKRPNAYSCLCRYEYKMSCPSACGISCGLRLATLGKAPCLVRSA